MKLNLDRERLPEIYTQGSKRCYLDPIRRRLVMITPEETVRQQMLSYLIDKLNVPKDVLLVEERLSHYGVDSPRRADIIINENTEDNTLIPVCIVECKAPGTLLGEAVINQVMDYCDSIGCNYAIVANGSDAFFYKYDEKDDCYYAIEGISDYKNFTDDKFVLFNPGPYPERIPFDKINEYINNNYCYEIGEDSPQNIAHFAFNLSECFLDTRHTPKKTEYDMFKIIKDYGIRLLEYGNSSGGVFSGAYRSFLIDNNGDAEFVSFALSGYTRGEGYPVKTAINVAMDTEKSAHHALQLSLDDYAEINGNSFKLYHNGRIGIGNIGSGRISELKELISERYPKLLVNDSIYLGTLTDNRLFDINDEQVADVFERLVSYALIRDEYRKTVKERKKTM